MQELTSDQQLVADLMRDPSAYWRQFVDRFAPLIVQVIRHCRTSQQWALDADDEERIVAQVSQRLLEDDMAVLRRFPEGASVTTCLTVAVRRIALSAIRQLENQRRLSAALDTSKAEQLRLPVPARMAA